MPLNSRYLTSYESFSCLPVFNYKPTFNRLKHSQSVKQCIPHLIAYNFNSIRITFNKLGISQLIHAQHRNNILKDVGKQALSMASMLLFTFLIQQVQLTPSLAITQILNSDFQSNIATRDPEAITVPDVQLPNNFTNVIDIARVLSPAQVGKISQELQALEDKSEWKLRVLTRSGPSPSPSDKSFRELWRPDDRTVIIVEDISSPNILNFGTGLAVGSRLPRQFFGELQSRYGNQFFVSDEGYQAALLNSIDAIKQCIVREDGCRNVPGLTDDLYFLTLATSIAGGCVFGFAARLSPQGRVEGSWQWVVLLSPLWLLLFASFGILPIVGRTSDWEPLVKNSLGFLGAAAAFYLTPIFGKSPIEKN